MGKVLSLRLKDDQLERLQRAARRLNRTPSEAAALLLEESLRARDFAFIEFHDSPVGRQAYLQGSRLAVWQVVALARGFGDDTGQTASHLEIPANQVAAALRYAQAYPAEIDAAIADSQVVPDELTKLIPDLEAVTVDTTTA